MFFPDPFNSDQYLRRLDDREAADGRGNKYRLERKPQYETHPLFVVFMIVFIIALLNPFSNSESPQSHSEPTYPQSEPTYPQPQPTYPREL